MRAVHGLGSWDVFHCGECLYCTILSANCEFNHISLRSTNAENVHVRSAHPRPKRSKCPNGQNVSGVGVKWPCRSHDLIIKRSVVHFHDRKSRPLGKISNAWIEAVVDGQKRQGAFAGVMIWRLLAVGEVPSLRELCLFSLDAFCLNLSTENLSYLLLLPVADRLCREAAAPPSHLSNTLARQDSVENVSYL